MPTPKLVLGSSSPRRRDLLARIGVTPDRINSPDIDENPYKGEIGRVYALRMAQEKAAAIARGDDEIVIAGDTTVVVGRRILPQAENEQMQRGFLELLSGRRHNVYSAVCVIDRDGNVQSKLSVSAIKFKCLHADEIESYIDSGEGIGKAGGYAIQGRAEALIGWMQGSHSGTIGLPLYESRILLKNAGYPVG